MLVLMAYINSLSIHRSLDSNVQVLFTQWSW